MAIFLIIPLFSNNSKQEFYSSYSSEIIDIKINEKCLENKIFTGFDIFKQNYNQFLSIMNVGIVANHTSDMITVDDLNKKITVNLSETNLYVKKIFTPEHGLNNQFQAGEKILGDIRYKIIVF